MTVPFKYANTFIPVKYFLTSYRALSDGRSGIRHLDEQLASANYYLPAWKVTWIGTCSLLRSAIDLFKVDQKSCLAHDIRKEIKTEYQTIKKEAAQHSIYWEFLQKERNNVLHEYQWQAYEAWMKPDGSIRSEHVTLLGMLDNDDARPLLLMRDGYFKGQNSLDLLKESADWVEARIFSAIRRAGLDPDEERGLVHFQPRPTLTKLPKTVLGGLWFDEGEGEDDAPKPSSAQ